VTWPPARDPRRWRRRDVAGPDLSALNGQRAPGARLDDQRRHLGVGIDEEHQALAAQVGGHQEGLVSDIDLAGLGMRLERLALTECIDKTLARYRAWRDAAGEDLAGRRLQAAVAMRQVDRLEHAVEQLLQVDQVDDDLVGQPANEPGGSEEAGACHRLAIVGATDRRHRGSATTCIGTCDTWQSPGSQHRSRIVLPQLR